MKKVLLFLSLFFTGCSVEIPEGLQAVDGIDVERYLGTWYEIARLDHSFERGLSNVTATYQRRDDGGLKVLNKGFKDDKGEWSEVEGKAFFVAEPTLGRLKVSFFGPFYGGYNIIKLDKENYSYVLICGDTREYFWILSRTKTLPAEIQNELVTFAKEKGFATDKLIYVKHDK
ncbi:MAG: hypothetical protein AMXMBFR48_19710 [Ignavibacteriales bacterium]